MVMDVEYLLKWFLNFFMLGLEYMLVYFFYNMVIVFCLLRVIVYIIIYNGF